MYFQVLHKNISMASVSSAIRKKKKNTEKHSNANTVKYLSSHGENIFKLFGGAHQPRLEVINHRGRMASGVGGSVPTLVPRVAQQLKIHNRRV